MANTAMNVPTNVSSPRSGDLRPMAASFQCRIMRPSVTSATTFPQPLLQDGNQASTVLHDTLISNATPNLPATIFNLTQQPSAGQQFRLSSDNSQSQGHYTWHKNEQFPGVNGSRNLRTAAPGQFMSPQGMSHYQKKEYHESTEKYWPDNQITFTPSDTSFVVGMLARKHMVHRYQNGTRETEPMPTGNQLFDMYKSGELTIAGQQVACSDHNCECGEAVRTLQHKVTLLQEEVVHSESPGGKHEFSSWEALASKVLQLEQQLSTAENEKKELVTQNNARLADNDVLTQKNKDLIEKLSKIENEKEMAERRKATAEQWQRQIARSMAIAQEQNGQASQLSSLATMPAQLQALAQTRNQSSRIDLDSTTTQPDGDVLGREDQEDNSPVAVVDRYIPRSPNSRKVRLIPLPNGGLESDF